ncbi:VWA domain-containing protein [Micromonospora zingiberis]|uniref:VWA domain-containing protein n=1 Tax=Micromonospora zingiberis TaxID=2053011 RepID=A0A4R0GMF7_9ACTN|nr:substrate-binding and VWA domain-containing protein [Micromonospora zingiberis]TCB98864.1 VWA domain-containing protein [Micromonospora zingiberis]
MEADRRAPTRALSRRSPVVLLSAALAVLLAGWAAVSYVRADRGTPTCFEQVRLRVVAAPVIAPALDRVARANAGNQPCVSVEVQARPSAAVTRELAEGGDVADAWLPESTFWLRRARAAGAFEVPAVGSSVASTPVVLAVNDRLARRSGWPAKALTWKSLVGTRARTVQVGLPDPAADPAGVAALLGVRVLADDNRDSAATVAATLRRLAARTFSPEGDGPLTPGRDLPGRVDVIAVSEQAVLEHNALTPSGKLVAAYPEIAVPWLDLPYVVLPGTQGRARDAAANFLAELLNTTARDIFVGHGFRTASGFPPAMPNDDRLRAEERQPIPLPAEETVTDVLTGWSGVQRSARILTLLDVSGSMAAQVPGGGTRLDATVRAAAEGAALLLDNSELGIWAFATRLDGDRDYREILPVGPLGGQRERLVEALDAVRVQPQGGTGLYDSTLAAYRDARRNWTPGRINLVLVMTDGRNEDDDGIGRAAFLAELERMQEPRRPLPIIFIGLGGEIDPEELKAIAKVTGGRVFVTEQPGGMRRIFFSALADLSCLPPECRR